ncbi:hypothetical protein A6A11_09145 [Bisgaardia hudsonensis]|nr:hypothetical protein A6A11_09145 [Bisgaardia hudsonensis]
MKITHCKLKKSIQKKLLIFVLEMTTHSIANILGIQANSAILFYHKIHQSITHYLKIESDENCKTADLEY